MEPPLQVLATLLKHPSPSLTEQELSLLWSYLVPNLDGLTTLDGQTVSVFDGGNLGSSEGPDVRDAGIELDGVRRRGDVEIHRQQADWYYHGHHRNPAYNGTILHLVGSHQDSGRVRREDGCWVPSLELPAAQVAQTIVQSIEQDENLTRRFRSVKRPCYQPETVHEDLLNHLEEAGETWFGYRSAQFRGQDRGVLFRELCGSLGYTRNHTAFERLARRLRPDRFQDRIRTVKPEVMEVGLLGLGGWLEDQAESAWNPEMNEYRRIWRQEFNDWHRLAVGSSSWRRSGVRPQAFPIRRWISFGYLTRNLPEDRWSDFVRTTVADWIREGDFRSSWQEWVRESGQPPRASYWRHHYTRSDTKKASVPRATGAGWADAVAVNVLLPYLSGQGILSRGTLEEVRSTPPTMTNRRLRRLRDQFGQPDLSLKNVLQQQGGVFLYKQGCREGNCRDCPLNVRDSTVQFRLFEPVR